MSKAVLIICLVGLGISTILLVVSKIQLVYWQRKKRKTLNDLMVLWKEAEEREKDTKEYEETDGVIKIKKQSANDVGEIKHVVVCSPNHTRYFYNDSMPIPYKGGDKE